MGVYLYPSGTETELKNAYIGEVIECDFTKSDYWFTYSSQWGYVTSYGRDSNGFWVRSSSAGGVSWKVPSSIYSRWTLKRAEFVMLCTGSKWGWGLGTGYETKRMRHYTCNRVIWGTQNNSGATENPTANTEWKFTADLENKIIYSNISTPNEILALTDNAISAFHTDWAAWNVTMHAAVDNGYTYIKSAIFYF